VYEIRFRAKEIIDRRTTEQIELIELPASLESSGQYLPYTGPGAGYVWSSGAGNNTAVGYQASYATAGSGLSIGNIVPNNTITFNQAGKTVLVITNDGDVEWHGKPSEAADALQTVFQFKVEDMKGVTKAARRRYYLKACQNILNKAEKMEHSEFIAFLQKQVYNKERRVIMDTLKGTE
jgi:hypothetical protein